MSTSVWILGDQLLKAHPALTDDTRRVVMVESLGRAKKRPYNAKKLIFMFSAMRHYADYLRGEGFEVDYVQAESFTAGLREHIERHQPDTLITMAAADYAGRTYQHERLPALFDCEIDVLPNTQFLVEQFNPIPEPEANKRYVMEYFYRDMRRHFDVLMEANGEPTGGQWNYDKQNREPLPDDIRLPEPDDYEPDDITQDVMEMVAGFGHTVGQVQGFRYAVTHAEAEAALQRFVSERLHDFGPYEDAMTEQHTTLFHSVLSPYLNVGLLTPMQCIEAVTASDAPINSVEGFVRQVLGWREFMYWQYWRQMPALMEKNAWNATRPMPLMFWEGETDMNCIRQVVRRARDEAYAHHIERLMIVTNYCTLAGIEPQAVVDWFSAFFVDAYDWVMQPNVVGMGLNADGGITATKPYIASSNYINKMSDYCKGCELARSKRHGEGACTFNVLYWNFLLEHEDTLRSNPRFGKAVFGLRYLDEEERDAVRAHAADYFDTLDDYEGA